MKKINAKITIGDIVIDEELYPRSQCNWQTAYDYSESMKSGAKFPPITVAKYNKIFLLIDGRHRMEAITIALGRKKGKAHKIKANVLVGLNKKQIFEESIRMNIVHGRPFSVQEKLQIAAKLKDLHYTTEKISKLIQIPSGKLKNLQLRRLTNTLTGEEIVLKKDVEHLAGTTLRGAQKDIEIIQMKFRGNHQIDLLDEIISLIKTKALNIKDKKVKSKVKILKTLLRKF